MDETQVLWGLLKKRLQSSNPQISSWLWKNYAIGGANEAWPTSTATELGITPPSWWVDPDETWLSYVEPLGCDALFYLFGTNASTSGIPAGTNAAVLIAENLAVIETWAKKPNVVIITNKSAYYANQTSGDDSGQSSHKAQAAFHRTFALTGGKPYTVFPQLKSLGFGLIDVGRYFEAYTTGKDFSSQYLEAEPSCVAAGHNLTTGAVAGDDPTTVCTSPDGDYRMTIVLKSAGGTVIGGSGVSHLRVGTGLYGTNYHIFQTDAAGVLTPKYVLSGALSGANGADTGTPTATSEAADVTITIVQSGPMIQHYIDGVLVLDIVSPRFVSGNIPGGTPINVNVLNAPASPIAFDVTEAWTGRAIPTGSFRSDADAYGEGPGATSCTTTTAGCQGGNSINHMRGSTSAFDMAIIEAYDFHVPPPRPGENLLFNPSVEVDQQWEGVAQTVTATGLLYCADMWLGQHSNAALAVVTCERVADGPPGSSTSLKFTVTTSGATAAGDFTRASQPLPADTMAKLEYGLASAKPVSELVSVMPRTTATTLRIASFRPQLSIRG
jgi:hypothetical protein